MQISAVERSVTAHLQLSLQLQFSAQLQLGEHASQAPVALEPVAHAQLQPGPQSQVAEQPHEFSLHFGHVMMTTAHRQRHQPVEICGGSNILAAINQMVRMPLRFSRGFIAQPKCTVLVLGECL